MSTDIKVSELNEINSNKTINQLIVNDRSNSSDAGITRKVSIQNLLPVFVVGDSNQQAVVGNAQLISTSQSPGAEAVDTNVIRDNAVTGAKIANQTIINSNIATGAIDGRTVSTAADITSNSFTINRLTVAGQTTLNTQTYNWPTSFGSGKYLKVDNSGNLSWDNPVIADFNLTLGKGLSANTSSGNINLSGGKIEVLVDGTTIGFDGSNKLTIVSSITCYESPQIPLSTLYTTYSNPTWLHGRGTTPKMFQATAICLSPEGGYSVGDVVDIVTAWGNWDPYTRISICASPTYIKVINNITSLVIANNGSGNMFLPTASKWVLKLKGIW